jgi:hypothetical protein
MENDTWANQPPSHKDFERLHSYLVNKNVSIRCFVGNFAFDKSDTHAYYLTPQLKVMRVKTTWEPHNFGHWQKIHWNTVSEF